MSNMTAMTKSEKREDTICCDRGSQTDDNVDEPEDQSVKKVPLLRLLFESSIFTSCNVFYCPLNFAYLPIRFCQVLRVSCFVVFEFTASSPFHFLSIYLSSFYTWIRICATALVGRLFGFCFVVFLFDLYVSETC